MSEHCSYASVRVLELSLYMCRSKAEAVSTIIFSIMCNKFLMSYATCILQTEAYTRCTIKLMAKHVKSHDCISNHCWTVSHPCRHGINAIPTLTSLNASAHIELASVQSVIVDTTIIIVIPTVYVWSQGINYVLAERGFLDLSHFLHVHYYGNRAVFWFECTYFYSL